MIVYILTLALDFNGGSIDAMIKTMEYAKKIGVTREMTKAECEYKLELVSAYIKKNKLGKGYGYCNPEFR